MVKFCPDSEPYTRYARTVRKFFGDAAIIRATAYWNTGEIPPTFKWLSLIGTGVAAETAQVEDLEDPEDEIIDPLTPTAGPAIPVRKASIDLVKMAPPKKKPTTGGVKAAEKKPAPKPKTLGRPKKPADATPIQRKASITDDSIVKTIEAVSQSQEKFNPPPEFKLLAPLFPKPALQTLN